MESIADNIEEIEEEYLILRDLCLHPNIPSFYGLFLKKHPSKREEDQLWFVMEVRDYTIARSFPLQLNFKNSLIRISLSKKQKQKNVENIFLVNWITQ